MRHIIILILLLSCGCLVKAQDPVSSQFYFNQLNMNPAFAGYNYGARFGGTYRNQWKAIPSKFVTYNCWADIYTPAMLNGGIGVIAAKDVSGEGFLKTTSVGIIQSFQIPIPKIMRLRTGYNVVMTNKRVDWDKLVFSDQIDPIGNQVAPQSVSPGNPEGKTFADFSAGFIAESNRIKLPKSSISLTGGYSGNHLTKPNESLDGSERQVLPLKHTFHFSTIIEVMNDDRDKKPWAISPNFIYERQGNTDQKGKLFFKKRAQFSSFNAGFYLMHSPIITGFLYRKRTFTKFKDNDAFIFFLGLRKEPLDRKTIFRVGYSYDLTVNSNLFSNTSGSHEISLSIEFKDIKLINKKAQKRKKGKRNSKCPDFGTPSILFR
ncbi:MAG: PorP/SprF family type IX secretion system membrane protein [Bacteroidetes bacterium]|nr:PorP/SprF family type IX secretion system membrane protein [Bacteroidota bacterium]